MHELVHLAVQHRKRFRRVVLAATATGSIMVPAHPRVLMKMVTPRRHRDPHYAASIAATLYGGATVTTVLTGMGSDGTEGVRLLGAAGGVVIVQDEATSTVWGMPGSIARAGLAHDILPLGTIGGTLRGLIGGGA